MFTHLNRRDFSKAAATATAAYSLAPTRVLGAGDQVRLGFIWHAIQTIAACKAGKDVYVEKPLSITIAEGRAMVEAARRHERIVQVGTHWRSSRLYMHLTDVVR
jgi:hypothetical protein